MFKLSRLMLVTAGLVVAAPAALANGTLAGRIMAGSNGLGNAVVYLEGVPGHFSPPAQHVIIDQQNKTFIPHVTAVMKGGIVEFLNSDAFLHNTYSASKTQSFNFNQPANGSRSLLRTDKVGVIEVRCHIHANMQAWIIVVDNPFHAISAPNGIFRIDGVPPGAYHLKVWSEQYGVLSQEVHVTAAGGRTIVKYAAR